MKTVKRKSVGTNLSMCVQPAFIIGTKKTKQSVLRTGVVCKGEIVDVPILDASTKLDPVIYSGMYHSIGKRLGKIGDFTSM